ncbi:hypothetical protein ACGYK1_17125 [Sulfitobacter sp. 1A13191]|uniref:hypothetical protein n=1 Tax=Sulfitobacter sp. 1A13191 TaxID=3368589 RepID=UPI003746ABFD
MTTQASVFRIIKFALIKVVPGLFNIGLIPYLLVTLGPVNYGLYSIWLSYAMLVANALAAIVSQPMYRFLSSRPEERDHFASFGIGAAGIAGVFSAIVVLIAGAPWWIAFGFGILSVGTVLGTVVSIEFVIDGLIARLAAYEALRVCTIFVAIAIAVFAGDELGFGIVVFAMALSNVLPLVMLAKRYRFSLPGIWWLRRVAPYGVKSATWLILAGLPVVSAKSILLQAMPEGAFGTYAAITDLTYRGFSIANAALIMWAFPLLSRQFDAGEFAEARQTLRLALLLYSFVGIAMILGVAIAAEELSLFNVSVLPGGLYAAIAIAFANFGWHIMSISHKPLELSLRTTRMAVSMALAVCTFYVLVFTLTRLTEFNALYVVTLTMTGVSLMYAVSSLGHKPSDVRR